MNVMIQTEGLLDQILEKLDEIYDPEIPISILQMGLIYKLIENEPGKLLIEMTFTSPGCPAAQEIPNDIVAALYTINGITEIKMDIVWQPTWTPDMITPEGKVYMGM